MKTQKNIAFINYMTKFYGHGGIYDMKATKDMITQATEKYIAEGADFCGDSTDREFVRDIMIRDYRLQTN
jgi:hypothetical protein